MNISDEDAKKLGKQVTSNHPLAVFGMAKSSIEIGPGFEITSSTVTAVRTDGCEIRVTLCRGDLCEMKKTFYKFQTPLRSPSDLERKIDSEVREKVCSPDPLWLVTDPIALGILVVVAILGFGTYVGTETLSDALLGAPKLDATISLLFGSSRNFATLVSGSFWFSIVAHGLEAVIAVYYSMTKLGLGVGPACTWGILVFLVGYAVFARLLELVKIQNNHAKAK